MNRFISSLLNFKWITVECWFCQQKQSVQRANRNAFYCSACCQYNGFTKSGDYNRDMSEIFNQKDGQYSNQNVLCSTCLNNENLKLHLINNFEPVRTDRWEHEYEKFKRKIERCYPLCNRCETSSKRVILDIDGQLLPRYLSWFRDSRYRTQSLPAASDLLKTQKCFSSIIRALRCLSFLLICFILIPQVCKEFAVFRCLPNVKKQSLFSHIFEHLPLVSYNATLPYCDHLIKMKELFEKTMAFDLQISMIFLVVQLFLVFSKIKSIHKRRTNPLPILLDTFLIVFVSNHLQIYFTKLSLADMKIYINIVVLSVIISLSLSSLVWLPFCKIDLKKQKKNIVQSLPKKTSSDRRSRSRQRRSSQQDFELKNSPFASPVNKSPLSAHVSAMRDTESLIKGVSVLSTSDHSDFDSSRNDSRSVVSSPWPIGESEPRRSRSRRRSKGRKYLKRTSLMRAILYALFGNLDSWEGLKKEIIVLFNAIVMISIIYGSFKVIWNISKLL